jgi:2-desacetyl-2-hydroxyethyl bacteriochlorophyllide A dehydrogenase
VRAVVIERPGTIGVRDVPDPRATPGMLVVEIGAAGICGTDLHILKGEFALARYPCVPGHEFAGTVVEVGSGVTGYRIGDRVGVDPSIFCGTCDPCRNGRANLCRNFTGYGTTLPGAFAERTAVLASQAYRLPDDMPFPNAALAEPVACAIHGMRRLGSCVGDRVLVVGGGTMGLILGQLARFGGARHVTVVEVNPARRELARAIGFSAVEASVAKALALVPGGFEAVVEATGTVAGAEAAFEAVGPGGRLLLFGVYPPSEIVRLEAARIFNCEMTILSSLAVFQSYGRALAILSATGVDASRMVTHTYPLASITDALEAAVSGDGLKVQIAPCASPGGRM